MKYGNRPLSKKILQSPIAIIVAIILLVILARAAWGIRVKAIASATRLSQAESELSKLKAHEKDLSDQVRYLSSESGIESELRTKYRAVKDGESVAVILDRSQTASVEDASSTNQTVASVGWWQRLIEFFGL